MKILKSILLYLWQLPQNLAGLLLLLFLWNGRELHTDDPHVVVRSSYRMPGGISSGGMCS